MRIVIKVGSNTLTNSLGNLDHRYIASLIDQIFEVCADGHEVVLVTSGAIAAGLEVLGIDKKPTDMPTLQACASTGQVALIELYAAQFGRRGKVIGQVLLTRNDTENETAYRHACDTFDRLLSLGAVPIVNENDTVAVEEIAFGDNDTLAALVAEMIHADLVVVLTDIEGLYSSDPRTNKEATLVKVVTDISKEVLSSASGTGSVLGSGGMRTKVEAAAVLMSKGIDMVLCDGRRANVIIEAASDNNPGTRFVGSIVKT